MRTRSAGPLADPAELNVSRGSTRKSADKAGRKRQQPQQQPTTTGEEEQQVQTPSDEAPEPVGELNVSRRSPRKSAEKAGRKRQQLQQQPTATGEEEEQVQIPSDEAPEPVGELNVSQRSSRKSAEKAGRKRQQTQQQPTTTGEEEEQVQIPSDEAPEPVGELNVSQRSSRKSAEKAGRKRQQTQQQPTTTGEEEEQVQIPSDEAPEPVGELNVSQRSSRKSAEKAGRKRQQTQQQPTTTGEEEEQVQIPSDEAPEPVGELNVSRRSPRKSAVKAGRKRQQLQQQPTTTGEEEEQVQTPSDEASEPVGELNVSQRSPRKSAEKAGRKRQQQPTTTREEEEQVQTPSDEAPKPVDEPETTSVETPLPLEGEEQPQSQSQSPPTQANPNPTACNETVFQTVSEVVEPQSAPQTEIATTPEEASAPEVDPPLELDSVAAASEEPPVKFVDITKAEALKLVANAEPTSWLSASPGLVQHARAASEYLFNVLALQTESPLDKLFTEGFDSEQIWQQIDLQATPTLAKIKKLVRRVEKTPAEQLFPAKREELERNRPAKQQAQKNEEIEEEVADFENGDDMSSSDDDDGEDVEEKEGGESEEYSDYDEEEKKGVEDKFLKLTEMEKFLDRADAEDAGLDFEGSDDEDESDEDGDEEDLEVDEAFDFSAKRVDGGEDENAWGPKYSEFVGKPKKQKPKPSKVRRAEVEELSEMDTLEDTLEEDDDGGDSEMETEDMDVDVKLKVVEETNLSAHEKQQGKVKKRIEQLEKANMDTKSWTMQGEVTASKRPKNSALEVELDFEHGARPAPVVTEEITQSIEEMIRLRIIESKYDDPQPRAAPSTATPKERVELDEEKSKKGLGEIYEQDYMVSTGLAPAATPATQTLKAEADVLFKNLCNKLDALSHFHFAPKPTIEEVAVKVDVPALAMEEVAPLAVSDVSMLAPEEVYKSAGIVKGEGELTPDERKRRRAAKKRKRKGAKKAAENDRRVRIGSTPSKDPLKEMNVRHIPNKDKRATSSFGKSAKVFAELDNAKERGNKAIKPDKPDKPSITPSFLKL